MLCLLAVLVVCMQLRSRLARLVLPLTKQSMEKAAQAEVQTIATAAMFSFHSVLLCSFMNIMMVIN
jgi:hypothetical protein